MDARTILIVDDERYITLVVRHKLEDSGYNVLEARDGAEASEIARDNRPDLVVTDLQMPVLDGLGLAADLACHHTTADIPMILLTSRGHRVRPSDLIKTNIRAVMPKPFSPRKLIAQIEELLLEAASSDAKANAA
jgi:DNA-binding response OmpR family regulator